MKLTLVNIRWVKITWLPTLPGFQEQKESCSLSTFTGLIYPCIVSSDRSSLRYNALFKNTSSASFVFSLSQTPLCLGMLYKQALQAGGCANESNAVESY